MRNSLMRRCFSFGHPRLPDCFCHAGFPTGAFPTQDMWYNTARRDGSRLTIKTNTLIRPEGLAVGAFRLREPLMKRVRACRHTIPVAAYFVAVGFIAHFHTRIL